MDMIRKIRKSSSSEEVVLNQDEDLLTLILLRLPGKELMSLKSVSRQWNSLITSPHFAHLHNLHPLRVSGLFIQHSRKVYFVPLDDPDTPSLFIPLTFALNPFDPPKVLLSCNGLLLCSCEESDCKIIYNPTTDQLAILPHLRGNWVCYIGLAFDPSKSPHYKVIAFVSKCWSKPIGDIHIYSSETKTWRVSVKSFDSGLHMYEYFDRGIYWKGCVHWLRTYHIKHEEVSDVPDGFYFNVDDGRLGTFPRPPISEYYEPERSLYFGESEDHLHFTESCAYTTSLSVYEMKSDYSEWFLKYQIDLAPISKAFPEITNYDVDGYKYKYAVDLLSLVRRENFQEDSFLVLGIPGKVIRYNLVDRSFKVLWEYVVDLDLKHLNWASYRDRLIVWQYIETLSCV